MIKNVEEKHIILFGCGAVNKCVLHYLDKYLKIDPYKLLIIDLIDYRTHPDVLYYTQRGATYTLADINKEYKTIIEKLNKNDIIIDLSNRTDSLKIIEECLIKDIHYINTSLEDPISPNDIKKKEESLKNTYQYSHNMIQTLKNKYKDAATSILCGGMNPGTITIMTKLAILFLAHHHKPKTQELNIAMNERDYGRLCEYLQVELIHCSETDSAIYTEEPNYKKFTNTWCCQGLVDEYSDNCQLTWGTDQQELPKKGEMLGEYVATLNEPANKIYSESFVPFDGKIIGCCISHSEQISGSNLFSTPTHCPTIHYVYRFSPITQDSTLKMKKSLIGGTFPKNSTHVLNNYEDKFKGIDRVGALIITKDKKAVWAGSILSNDESHIGLHSGTTAQVAVSVLSFLQWMLDNPNKGANFPESVEEDYILKRIKPYYGFYIDFVDYKPDSLQFQELQRTKAQFNEQFI